MFLMISGVIVGIILGVMALLVAGRKPSMLGWVVLVFGVLALVSILPILISVVDHTDPGISPVFSILAGTACLVAGISAVAQKRDRRWQAWLGIALGCVPVIFWLWFSVGELLYPH